MAVAVLALGCGTGATRTYESSGTYRGGAQKKIDTSRYRTFQWLGQDQANELKLQSPNIDFMSGFSRVSRRPEIEDQLKSMIISDLKADGYVLDEATPSPDFYVTFYGATAADDWVSSWEGRTASVNGVPVVIFPNFSQNAAFDYKYGTLAVVIYDRAAKSPAWTGLMTNAYSPGKIDIKKVTSELPALISRFKKSA